MRDGERGSTRRGCGGILQIYINRGRGGLINRSKRVRDREKTKREERESASGQKGKGSLRRRTEEDPRTKPVARSVPAEMGELPDGGSGRMRTGGKWWGWSGDYRSST